MTNFLEHESTQPEHKKNTSQSKKDLPKARSRRKRIAVGILALVGIGILATSIIAVANYGNAISAYQKALSGRDAFLEAQDAVLAQDFATAKLSLEQAKEDFSQSQDDLSSLTVVQWIPYVGRQYRAVQDILTAGVQTASALLIVTDLGEEMNTIVNPSNNPDLSFSHITPEQKREILKLLYESPPDLVGAQADVQLAVAAVNQIPDEGLLKPIQKAAAPLKDQLPKIKIVIDQAVPFAEVIPQILGYPEEKNYLFMLQNNSELRPTGGFIGTYGELTLRDGEIDEFTTDNIYNLDNPGRERFHETPPWPLRKYLGSRDWLARDANWSPDFPTSAQQFETFYEKEGGKLKDRDGVIAVTPQFIASLLKVTGPIKAQGIEFTTDNLVETLQYQVEQGFLRQGIDDADRKEVIGELASKLLEEVQSLPKTQWVTLWEIFQENVESKHILISLHDQNLEKLVQEQGWGGEVLPASGDYLFIVDANLASLKSDPAVKRTYTYSVQNNKEKGLVAKLTLNYQHTGNFDFFTTRYHTYVRVLVPEGSELLSSDGVEEKIETTTEFGKTIFGTYKTIEPQDTEQLTFEYVLPKRLLDDLDSEGYNLTVQKQGGTASYDLFVNVDIGKSVDQFEPIQGVEVTGNTAKWTTTLAKDQKLHLSF